MHSKCCYYSLSMLNLRLTGSLTLKRLTNFDLVPTGCTNYYLDWSLTPKDFLRRLLPLTHWVSVCLLHELEPKGLNYWIYPISKD